MAIADTPLEALMLTSLWVTSLIAIFALGVILEHKRMKRQTKENDSKWLSD